MGVKRMEHPAGLRGTKSSTKTQERDGDAPEHSALCHASSLSVSGLYMYSTVLGCTAAAVYGALRIAILVEPQLKVLIFGCPPWE